MKFRQAKKILRMVAWNRFAGRTIHCDCKKAGTVYMRHFRKGKKKVTTRTIMPFMFPVGA